MYVLPQLKKKLCNNKKVKAIPSSWAKQKLASGWILSVSCALLTPSHKLEE